MFDYQRVGADPQLHYTVHLPALARSVQVPTSSGWQPGALTFWWWWTCLFLYSQPRLDAQQDAHASWFRILESENLQAKWRFRVNGCAFPSGLFGFPTKTYQHQHCRRCRSPFSLVTSHPFKDQLSSMSRQQGNQPFPVVHSHAIPCTH